MKCLSVSQPYADLIINGKKTIELRTWNTKFRGEFLIHAPIKIKDNACEKLGIDRSSLRTGVIIGKAEIYDVKLYDSIKALREDYNKHFATEEFLRHKYGFLLRKPHALRVPIPYKGSLGFFEVKIRSEPSNSDIRSELFDEEYRYQWIGKH
ncbi:ASCH domain-containing protein [Candidatus Nitrosotalea okcheonensis]|uniref:Putative activating signal cointegrator 1 n=1 Tax=Candidatus Nitrosotalea okcheonensis TaxID=1903276 RepID=A0A2H1FG78_9ARCH|nr:ASCH domain-containing protein [Candidatus Nitrosotalea okcheonensis]MDE1728460.1 ASCH domain-containing protein [Nitrososphaerota archaeon]MDE1831588.1 ASCH domain-containing protein [Nitrososphaerota archaeon]MDE1878430.1 ASCH domain-containing protein [Nitrososphaerota archaeon]SMH71770.1 putative activating signal cointegrator 1 [Candidatus Nitrosotalea okcheonensis]